jgi:Histidine ammonia-lyase
VIDGSSLSIDDVSDVACKGATVSLSPDARARMSRTQTVISDIVRRGDVVYGVTTGFGKLSEIAIPRDRLAELQVNLVAKPCCGSRTFSPGARSSRDDAAPRQRPRERVFRRAARPCRSACRNAQRAPSPADSRTGKRGASGDLAPLAALGLALIGEGKLTGADGSSGNAADVLRSHGLAPLTLGPKEGITLINGTQAHTGIAALAVNDALTLWRTAHVAGAMSLEALLGTPVAFDARIQDARGQSGQSKSAELLRGLLNGSELRESHRYGDPRVQDAYCLRCMPQVHGPVLDALEWIAGIVGRELNAATDNPLVFENGETLSGGNFHGQAVGMALDLLAIVMTNLATIAERRIDRLVHPDFNQGLPAFLSPEAGVNSGFMMAQVTAAALASECKVLSHPATVDTIPTDGNREDVVPMSMGAAWKARRVVDNVRNILAIELMCAAQGLDCRLPLKPGVKVGAAHAAVRRWSPASRGTVC